MKQNWKIEGEEVLGSWLKYFIPCFGHNIGYRLYGHLIITNKKVIFNKKYKKTRSLLISAISTIASDDFLEKDATVFNRVDIKSIDVKKSFLKKITITLFNGQEYIIDNGILSIDATGKALLIKT